VYGVEIVCIVVVIVRTRQAGRAVNAVENGAGATMEYSQMTGGIAVIFVRTEMGITNVRGVASGNMKIICIMWAVKVVSVKSVETN
jgi:hypothetical protein